MKIIFTVLLVGALSACNTVSGVLQGAGKDIQTVGKWVEPKPSVDLKEKR
jgi:predicted small secreted protein